MTNDEYKGLLAKMIAEPDTAQETASSILEEIEKDVSFLAGAKEELTKKDEQIKDLTSKVNSYKARDFLNSFGTSGNDGTDEKEPIKGIDWDALLKEAEDG